MINIIRIFNQFKSLRRARRLARIADKTGDRYAGLSPDEISRIVIQDMQRFR